MKDPRTARLAGVVIEYSTRLKKGESATVAGSPAAAPLLLAIYEKALAAGAFMYIRCALPEAQEIFYRTASADLLEFYRKQMPQSGWMEKMTLGVDSKKAVGFQKNYEQCRIIIDQNPTEAHLTVELGYGK